jgi:hypothetical protein
MGQIHSWIVCAIIEYREFVKTVARDTMAAYDFQVGMPSENKSLFERLTRGSKFLHLVGADGVSSHLHNTLNPN